MKMNRRNLFKALAAAPAAIVAQEPKPRAHIVTSRIGGSYDKHETFNIGPTETITVIFDDPQHPLYIRERK